MTTVAKKLAISAVSTALIAGYALFAPVALLRGGKR